MVTTLMRGRCERPGAALEGAALLPCTPWSVRAARGPGARPALEIYEAGDLVGLIVATPLAPQILRGARRAVCRGPDCALAWGQLPADGAPLTVTFIRGRLRGRAELAEVIEVGGWCWLAVAAGRFGSVTVSHRGTCERRRIGTGFPW